MKTNKQEIIILVAILLFALFIRVYGLGTPSLWVDESTSAMASKMIVEKGVPVFDSGLFYGRALFFHYSEAFFLLFGLTDFLVRFISVIFGLLTIILAYLIGREYSKSGGIIASLFMAVFYLEVFYSRQGRFYQLFQLAFFACLYLLYKSKGKPKYIYFSLVAFLIAYDSQIAGIILAPFLIIHILVYNRKYWYLSLIPVIFLIYKFMPAAGLSSLSSEVTANYFGKYVSYTGNMLYLIILFVPGLIWGFMKKKELTLLLLIPAAVMLIGIFSLETFALRYSYFFVFVLVLYSSLLLAFFYDKFGKIMLIAILCVLIIPSNFISPQTGVNILQPVNYNFNDNSAPYTDYKSVPTALINELKSNTTLISYFSSDVEWYIRKPDYVLPFSMNGIGNDQISRNNSKGEVVDRYSGALILNKIPEKPYNLLANAFSVSKLKSEQKAFLGNLTQNCSISYESIDLKVYNCYR